MTVVQTKLGNAPSRLQPPPSTAAAKMINFSTLFFVLFSVISVFCTLSSAANSKSAACPEDQSIIEPCTCISSSSSSRETVQSLPGLSCINFLGNTSIIPLENITKSLADFLTANGQSTELDRLLVVNGQLTGGQLTANQLGALQYHYLSVYETNLTTVQTNALQKTASTLTYLQIKSERLQQSALKALAPLTALQTLELNLGLKSMKIITGGSQSTLANLPALQQITLNGVVSSIGSGAFVNLTALKVIKVTNNLETIESEAFVFRDFEDGGAQQTVVQVDLFNNRLNERSFAVGFIRLQPSLTISLNLTANKLRYLPEDVFRPFFEVNKANHLQLLNNPFECGHCESYWVVDPSSPSLKGRLNVNCSQSNKSVWIYDWSHCRNGGEIAKVATSLVALVMIVAKFVYL